MTLAENLSKDPSLRRRAERHCRATGVFLGSVLFFAAAAVNVANVSWLSWSLAGAALPIIVATIFRPTWLSGYRALAIPLLHGLRELAWSASLALIFCLIMIPAGWVRRMLRVSVLQPKNIPLSSYWIKRRRNLF